MDYSMIFALIWKIVYAVLLKEGVFSSDMNFDVPGMSTPQVDTTTQTDPAANSGNTSSNSFLDSLINRFTN